MTLDRLTQEYTQHFPHDQRGIGTIAQAYEFAKNAHRGQKRKSGDEYFSHVYETALQLARWRLDWQSVAAGLLHDVIEDCEVKPQTLESTFGGEITFLVEGVSKLGTLRYRGEKESRESLRKMMLATSKDLRVIFIKLADRLHNVKTLGYLPAQKQKRIALETVEIYAPLADRLGMQNIHGELKDLAFPYLYPTEYQWIIENVRESYEERERYLRAIEPMVREHLERAGIKLVNINYRAKRYWSLYNKLLRLDMNLDQIYDLVAMRIVVGTIDECYGALGVLHQLWPPMPGRIKDYIAMPKPNGYRSLHTTVFCVDNKPTEFQIRTHDMHEVAQHGAAAHWFYESRKGHESPKTRHTVSLADTKEALWIKQLKEWQDQFPGSKEFVDALKVDLFSDRIFVLTPKGRVIDLPVGATPLDFAYHIHTDVGNSCIGTRVNNKIVPIDAVLQSGDMVEIIIQKNRKPSPEWARIVKTKYAKKKIEAALRRQRPLPKKTEYRIAAQDRVGLIKDISAVFSRNRISIVQIQSTTGKGATLTRLTANINNKEKAQALMFKLKKVKGVKEINFKTV